MIISFRGIYLAFQAPHVARQKKEATEAFMEALIPEPSPSNIRKYVFFIQSVNMYTVILVAMCYHQNLFCDI